jgi:hypothetical protein
MSVTRFGTCFALAALALVAAAGGGGCEAIVTNDVPAYTCSMEPFINAGNGACPAGFFCEGAGCVACNPKGDDPCDGYDNDCDGVIDDGPKSDHDGDGYKVCGTVDPTTGKQILIDCNDNDKTISPAGHEVCNGKDDNCDGIIDNPNLVCPAGETCVPTTGQCISNSQTCTTANCPAPNVCDPQTQQCVLPNSADAGTSCTSSEQCTSGICASSTELGSAGATQVCTEPCCTSADCAAGYVCYGAGTGGNYCIDATTINVGAQGSGAPGASCARSPDCRSGACTNSKCEDTCCSNTNCTNGTGCAAATFNGNTTLACIAPPGTTPANQTCTKNADCASGFCAGYSDGEGDTYYGCAQPCCSSHQCGTFTVDLGFGVNETVQLVCYDDYLPPASSGQVVPVCDDPQQSTGTSHNGNPPPSPTGEVGTSCSKPTDCYSNRCLVFPSGQFCSDVCCVDSDCGKAGWVCRPTPDGPGTFLRCVPSGG